MDSANLWEGMQPATMTVTMASVVVTEAAVWRRTVKGEGGGIDGGSSGRSGPWQMLQRVAEAVP